MNFRHPLPIDAVLDELRQTVQNRRTTLLVAPPGAGKSTRVPLAFLDEPWLAGRKIILLEPRRVAARAVAWRLARERGETVGQTVGYRMQGDTRVGADTRIEVVTEGVLTRMLLNDPLLAGVGLVIFDEFHERSLHADTGLALCLHGRRLFDTDLRLLIMSATLEADAWAEQLQAAQVTSDGRAFPVEVRYRDKPAESAVWEKALAATVGQAIAEQEGDILVFLPGRAEIYRAMRNLQPRHPGIAWLPLHGGMPAEEQDQALQPAGGGQRRVILATPVAETGLTVEGVRVVVDSGFMRISRFSPRTGMSRLETVRVSKASATQRRGRAGRLAPGVCYRLWTREEHKQLTDQRIPEMADADLAPLVLTLKQWGAEPDELFWLTPPPPAHYRQAEQLLQQLGLLTPSGSLTDSGKEAVRAGIHPRLARMIIGAKSAGLGGLACRVAALLDEHRLPREARDLDLQYRLDWLAGNVRENPGDEGSAVRQQIMQEARRLQRMFAIGESEQGEGSDGAGSGEEWGSAAENGTKRSGVAGGSVAGSEEAESSVAGHEERELCGALLSLAFPDRIGLNRGNGSFLLSNGRGAALVSGHPLCRERLLVVADADDSGANGKIHLAAPIGEEDLLRFHGERLEQVKMAEWSKGEQRVVTRLETRLDKLTLKSVPDAAPDPDRVLEAMLDGIRAHGLDALPWTAKTVQLRQRMAAMHELSPDWPDVSDQKLSDHLSDWLGPFLSGFRRLEDVARIPLHEALSGLLTWEQRAELDQLLPTHLRVPSGSRIPVNYEDPNAPRVAVRLQQVFGLAETPLLAEGRLPVVFHLLSPASRPVQITRDLAGFWQTGYHDVRKELKGRYPKHSWPDDPLTAEPTNRAKPRQQQRKDQG